MRTLILVLVMAAAGTAQETVYDPYDTPKRPPFKKRDHIQILVEERASALSTTDLRTDRRSRFEVDLEEWIIMKSRGDRKLKEWPRLRAAELTGNPGIDLDARFRQDSSGRTSRSFNLTFTITAEVVDVRPNGNLVLEARKRRKVNGETETIRLSGEVSPEFVTAAKTVRSRDIANLDIDYEGKGTTGDLTKRGWLAWLLDKLWPF